MRTKATTVDAYRLIHEGILALARAERQGFRIDIEYCEKKRESLTRKIAHNQQRVEDTKLYRRWAHIYGTKTNIYSNHQLARILYQVLKIEPPKMTEKGVEGATDEESLAQIDMPELKLILQMRKLVKIRDTYLGAFIRESNDGWIHPVFHLHTVRSYRSSSSDPNFQNIPKRDAEAMEICRRAIYPRLGHMLVEMDFASLEVMISACYHKDPTMLKYLRDKQSDMHADMAAQIFKMETIDRSLPSHYILRQAAKNGFVFPQFYGDYYGNNAVGIASWVELPQSRWKKGQGILLPDGSSISDHLMMNGLHSYNQFVEHMKGVEESFWGQRFTRYNQWRKAWVKKYRRLGYLEMLTGFTFSGVMRKNEIINYPMQGTAFHCLLYTFIELDKMMRDEGWDSRLVGQIHDSILMDVHPEELPRVEQAIRMIVKEMLPAAWKWIIVPLDVEIERYEIDQPWVKKG